jgi:hypothetical protein
MKALWLAWLVVLIGLSAFPARVRLAAQSTDRNPDTRLPRCSVTPYVGGARHSLAGTHLGVTPGRDHLFVGVHATVNVARTDRWALGYAPELVPLLLISDNPEYRESAQGAGLPWLEETGRGPVAGFAVSPIGLEGQLRISSRWRAYGAGAAGVVWFTRDVPTAYSRAFNYTFEVGGGLIWQTSAKTALRVGYKFHHLSNANTAPNNPGVDGAVFLLGYERAIGSR